jgi:hypothetical protein
MGYSPQQVNAMSMWQFYAAVDGFVKSHQTGGKLSDGEKDGLWDWLQSVDDRPQEPTVRVEFDPTAPLPVERVFSGTDRV